MKTGIMQPYLFPYIGYFQLIKAVDTFVIYDDVNYIKQGWINKNRILLNNNAHAITLELLGSSSFKKINEIQIGKNRNKIFKTIEQGYIKAPYFKDTIKVLEDIFCTEEDNLAKFLTNSIVKINNKLNIKTNILISSNINKDNDLKGADKVLHICSLLNTQTYINAIGGQELYSKEVFSKQNVDLFFLKTPQINYSQFNTSFVPWLSIIDIMMFNSVEEVNKMLDNYELV